MKKDAHLFLLKMVQQKVGGLFVFPTKAVTLDMPKLRATDGLDDLLRQVEPLICYTLAAAALRAGDRHKTGLSLALKNY